MIDEIMSHSKKSEEGIKQIESSLKVGVFSLARLDELEKEFAENDPPSPPSSPLRSRQ